MAKDDLHKKTDGDLKKELRDRQKALQQFRFGSAGSRTRNVKEGHNLRRDIARLFTELNARHRVGGTK
ncbi:50S ribosomal protein L29 [Candidatus Wolfebacteria bacterium]|nr:50S ribosomal protein L29 [Candidatus Wolfebacteria bacterium]